MQKFKIKPKLLAQKVLDPITFKALSDKGENKPRNSYWLRRLKDGSIIEIAAVSTKTQVEDK